MRSFAMSRSLGNRCGKTQTAESSSPEEGASLRLELMEDEYEFDVCPMNYDDGRNPYVNPAVLNVYAHAGTVTPPSLFISIGLTLTEVVWKSV